MKKRLVIMLTCLLILSSVVVAFSVNGEYEGFSIINVIINGERIKSDIPAVLFYGKTMMPVREVSDSINSMVDWNSDTKTVNIIKPEIDMIVAKQIDENQDGSISIANTIRMLEKGKEASFFGLLQLEGLVKGKYTYRIVILDPKGEVFFNNGEDSVVVQEDKGSFIKVLTFKDIIFQEEGTYKLCFQIKQGDSFKTLYQRSIAIY